MLASAQGRPELLVVELEGLERYGGKLLSLEEIVSVLDEATEMGLQRVTFEVTGSLRAEDLASLASSAARRIPAVTVSFEHGLVPDGFDAAELGDAGVADVAVPYGFLRHATRYAMESIDLLRDEGLGIRAVLAGWPGISDLPGIAQELASCGVTRFQLDVVCGSTSCPATSALLARLAAEVVDIARAGTLAMIVNELPMLKRIDFEVTRAAPPGARTIPRAPIELNDSRTTMRVGATGDVIPSRALPLIAGNVRRQRLDGIWSVSGLYPRLRDRERLVGRCGDCAWRESCGGSRARAWHSEGDYLAADPACALPIERTAGTLRNAMA